MAEVKLTETELRVFTYVTQHDNRVNLREASSALHLPEEEVEKAVDELSKKGVIGEKSVKEAPPDVVIDKTSRKLSASEPLPSLSASVKPSTFHGAIVGGVGGLVALVISAVVFVARGYEDGRVILYPILIGIAVAAAIGSIVAFSYRNKQ